MALEKVLALDSSGVIEKEIDTGGSGGGDDGVTAENICDLAMDGTTVINTMREWYYKPGIGVAKLIAHGKAGASTAAYISKGTADALTAGTSGAGALVATALGTFTAISGTTATGYATAYGGVEFSSPSAIANPYNLAINLSSIGSKLAATAAIDVDALSDATNSYEARLTLLGYGPLTNTAMAATTPGFSISYTHSVNSGNFVIQYRGADGTLKTVNTTVAPGVGIANTKRITLKAHRTATATATVTISIGGTVYTITDSSFNDNSVYQATVIGARMRKLAGTTSRSLNVRSPAVARNFT